MKLHTLMKQGFEALEAEKPEALGNLRGGNTGCYLYNEDSGKFDMVGKCPRKAYLRSKGHKTDEETTDDKFLMFAGGNAAETIWTDTLRKSYQGTIVCEEDIPTSWLTTNGTAVTGRPDAVLCTPEGKPELLLEFKKISSLRTSMDIALWNRVRLEHVQQAAHYMWQLGVPGKLCYVQLDNHNFVSYKKDPPPPRDGEPGSEFCKYFRPGEPFQILPHIRVFDLRFNAEGWVEWCDERYSEDDSKWMIAPASKEGIELYYEHVSKMEETDNLGPLPINFYANGEKAGWNECTYCPLFSTCKEFKGGVAEWMKKINKSLK